MDGINLGNSLSESVNRIRHDGTRGLVRREMSANVEEQLV